MSEPVLLEKQAHCAIITLNRPPVMNALSRSLRQRFVDIFTELQNDVDIRCAIITGAGRAFCAGFDLHELAEMEHGSAAAEADNVMARAIESFPWPIIAAVNGHAITGGFELALACDFMIASTEAQFADTHARVGILPGWGLSQRLPRLIGSARAKELSFTGNRINAQLAYEWGLVNRVVEPSQLMTTCLQLGQDISSCVPPVIKQYKKLIDDGSAMALGDALRYEEALAIAAAQQTSGAMIAARKGDVIARGRKDND